MIPRPSSRQPDALPLSYACMEEGGRIERRALIAPPRFSGPLGHHCPAPSRIGAFSESRTRVGGLRDRCSATELRRRGDDGANRTRLVALLQSAAFPLGYVVMVRDRRFELRITRVRAEAIPDVSLSRMAPRRRFERR